MSRVGIGWDAHAFGGSGPLVLGGVVINHETGLKGHSDADVLVHAMCDALLGAAGLPDLGSQFPDTDPAYKDIDSLKLLEKVLSMTREKGLLIENIDSVIIAQEPKLNSYLADMKKNIARILDIETGCVGVKASSPEGIGAIGKGEGIVAQAVACLTLQC